MLKDRESFSEGEVLLRNKPSLLVVYMSNTDHFVYDSYEQRTFFFLRKSHLEESLDKLMKKYNRLVNENIQFITIQLNKQKYELPQKDIICIESFRNQIIIQTVKTQYILYNSLKNIYGEVNHICFYRLNRYTIFNFSHVVTYNKERIQLTNDVKIIFTRGSKKEFEKAYLEYRSNQLWNGL